MLRHGEQHMLPSTRNYSSFSFALGNENRSLDGSLRPTDGPTAVYSFHDITPG